MSSRGIVVEDHGIVVVLSCYGRTTVLLKVPLSCYGRSTVLIQSYYGRRLVMSRGWSYMVVDSRGVVVVLSWCCRCIVVVLS